MGTLIIIIILGTLTSVPVSVVNFTYMILMNAPNQQMSRDYDSPFLQVEKMKSFAENRLSNVHKVTEVFVGTAIFAPRQLTLQLNLSALSYREGQKPGTFLGDGICASPSVIGAVRTIWGRELVGGTWSPEEQ